MSYQPIETYGLIGNMHTAALVGMDGSLDWLCLPRFDSPSVFAAVLDDGQGGRFQIAPALERFARKQYYLSDTNVLITRFLAPEGLGEITDFMPMDERGAGPQENTVVRRVRVLRGSVPFRMVCRPAFNYARDPHRVDFAPHAVRFHSPDAALMLTSTVPLSHDGNGGAASEFVLNEGQSATFLLQQPDAAEAGGAFTESETQQRLTATVHYWRRWIARCAYSGLWQPQVRRSALALKLLTYAPTGAMIAAPTTSLPETVGGHRNWDYRYAWVRDSAFVVYAFMRLGFYEEAVHFMGWIENCCHNLNPDGSLPLLFQIDGGQNLREEILPHLDGYRGSRPVRIGNAAHAQLQLDIYGELMDSVYLYNKYVTPISYDLWRELRALLNWVCDHWRLADQGMWETRSEPRHYVSSKLMCWVALDRGLRLANKRSFPADRERWGKERDAIYVDLQEHGWNARRRAFTQSYGSEMLDASAVIMPMVFFMSPTDPRVLSTLDAISQPLSQGGLVADSLAYRYLSNPGSDGLKGRDGSFNLCTFWLAEALTRAGRVDKHRLEHARNIFEDMMAYSNHLGLYSEETGLYGEALGNYPQAFTHLSLISAAVNLDRALAGDAFDWPGLPASDWTKSRVEHRQVRTG